MRGKREAMREERISDEALAAMSPYERLIRWRHVGDGPDSYVAGNRQFADDVKAILDERDVLRGALTFFASVIKSGEPWTETCEKTFRAALAPKEPGA